jgi:hypothetical protein
VRTIRAEEHPLGRQEQCVITTLREKRRRFARHARCNIQDVMQQPPREASTAGHKDTKSVPVRCVQCREVLDLKTILSRSGSMLCRDCAFDAPCTD